MYDRQQQLKQMLLNKPWYQLLIFCIPIQPYNINRSQVHNIFNIL